MDKIKITNLEVYANHGVAKEENILGQKFLVSLCLSCNTKISGKSDSIKDTINYSKIAHFTEKFMKDHTYHLIEAVAENLSEAILLNFPGIEKIETQIKKPWAPINLPIETVSVSIKRIWHTAYLALGSNLGNKEENMNMAIKLLQNEKKINVKKVSSFIVTKPMGDVEQDDFLNSAIEIQTLLDPQELLETVNKIEAELGRVRTIHWGPRVIDIDILFYDTKTIMSENLKIPHYGIQDREFVLSPMSEIAPQIIHPLLNKTVYQLLKKLQKNL